MANNRANVQCIPDSEADDPDAMLYMTLVRPYQRNPVVYVQMILSLFATALAIAALAVDEIYDGDWNLRSGYYSDDIKEIDFDCTWDGLAFTYKISGGYEQNEKFKYSSTLCSEDEDVFDPNWCSNMKTLGQVKSQKKLCYTSRCSFSLI